MSCTNLVRNATQSKQALSHVRHIAHETGRSRSATGDMPGPSRRGIRPRKHDDAVTPHLDPNKMTSTSIAHYYKSAESFQQIRANIYLNREYKGPSTKPIRPRSPSDSISNGVNKSTGATVSETKPPSRILSSEAWQQTMERRKEREETLKRLTQLIRFHYGDTYDARPFGSTCYGASSSTSDIDVVIIDADRPYGIPAGDKTDLPPIYDVRQLAKLLKEEGYKSVSSIPYAAVPLVKLTDPDTGMSCDVNINNRLGVFNTALLRQYCLRAPSLARYLRTVKLWVKSVDLNNPSGEIDKGPRSFSSYAITLMTVAYLQSTGHLPNLQADQDVIVDTHFWEHRLGTRRSVPISFGACKDWVRPQWLRPPTFQAWLRFWAHEFDFKERVISIRDGGFIPRPKKPPLEWGHVKRHSHDVRDVGSIVVLDPLSSRNCAYHIASQTLKRFQRECATALESWRDADRRRVAASTDNTADVDAPSRPAW